MHPGRVHSTSRKASAETEQSLARLEMVAKLMDAVAVVPGTNIRLGLDALIGIVPVVGDVISTLISSYLIWEARRLGAPRWLIARMSANVFMDTAIGAIPVLGDAFDVVLRANMKNMALLRRYLAKQGLATSGVSEPFIEGHATRVN